LKGRTVVISVLVHAGLAATLMGAATRRAAHKPVAVALSETKKKDKPKPAPPPPVARPVAPRKVASVAKPEAAPTPSAAPAATHAPAATAIAMSNDDSPGGIALPTKGAAQAAAAPTKVASAVTDARRKRMQEAAGSDGPGGEAPCNEEPTRPEPVFKQEIEYTAQARAEGVEGKLKLRLTVGSDGVVTKVDVVDSVSAELDAAAIVAAKLWRFKPAMACGHAIAGTYVVARRFELGD